MITALCGLGIVAFVTSIFWQRARWRSVEFAKPLAWFDWNFALQGVLIETQNLLTQSMTTSPRDGGPTPKLLLFAPQAGSEGRYAMLQQVVGGALTESEVRAASQALALPWLERFQALNQGAVPKKPSSQGLQTVEDYIELHAYCRNHSGILLLKRFGFARLLRRLSQAASAKPLPSSFYVLLAWMCARLNRVNEAIDFLGKAVYYSRHNTFAARVVVAWDTVRQYRLPLFEECLEQLQNQTRFYTPQA